MANIADAKKLFVAPEMYSVFALVYTDGRVRCDLLQVVGAHYSEKALADAWLENLKVEIGEVEPIVGEDVANKARTAATKMHEVMTLQDFMVDEPETVAVTDVGKF